MSGPRRGLRNRDLYEPVALEPDRERRFGAMVVEKTHAPRLGWSSGSVGPRGRDSLERPFRRPSLASSVDTFRAFVRPDATNLAQELEFISALAVASSEGGSLDGNAYDVAIMR